jgi:hypothetical protein
MIPFDKPCRSPWVSTLTLTALLAVAAGGCGTKTYPVRGKVIYKDDGKPVPGGVTVWFESTPPPYQRASGVVDVEGNFVLSTVRENSGAMQGEHRIRFEPIVPYHEPNAAMALAKKMPPRYIEYRTSGLKQTIAPGDNYFTIEVERPSRR